ncbi:hypothetical protein RKD27_008208 [Streptomyces sp. SAI-126]|uniref:hypothetical protein n=1 Tax=Streptomyces sp. SAI-126 TaxID=3377732 RepID=UPI003C7DD224
MARGTVRPAWTSTELVRRSPIMETICRTWSETVALFDRRGFPQASCGNLDEDECILHPGPRDPALPGGRLRASAANAHTAGATSHTARTPGLPARATSVG